MIALSQEKRSLSITTPLGENALFLMSLSGSEQLSGLFSFELELMSANHDIDATAIIGKPVTVSVGLATATEDERFFNGIISRFSAGITKDELRTYRAELVPALWMLTQTSNCRVFQNMTVPDIVVAVLKERGLTAVKTNVGSYEKLEYCIQYRESDFDFVSRLMQHNGMFYFFEHTKSEHTMVIADSNAAFKPGDQATVECERTTSRQSRISRITEWEHNYQFVAGKWAQTDYDFVEHPSRKEKSPARPLTTKADNSVKLPNAAKIEKFDYPGKYEVKADGEKLTKIRMEAEETAYHEVVGKSDCAVFIPGTKFKLDGHECDSENGKQYVLSSVTHHAVEGASFRGIKPTTESGSNGPTKAYQNKFTCVPDSVTYRPQRTTEKPRIHGSQTAVVVGPQGEEIWPDKYGRVLVQFFWDREGVRDENSSCWVRCSQSSAGNGWGSMFIPRVGQEVVITYLDGDPDRPLITGVVYNADQMPGYDLPDEKTKSYIRTNSSPGGEGFNEIRFEDLAEKEQIFVHAQKDMVEQVLNDRHLIVGQEKDGDKIGSQFEKVFADRATHILGNTVDQVEGNVELTIGKGDNSEGGALSVIVEKDRQQLVEGADDLHVMKDRSCLIDGANSLTVTGEHAVATDAGASLDAGADIAQKAGADFGADAGANVAFKAGADFGADAGANVAMKAGAMVVIEAASGITLKCGGNFVTIDASGVSVKGAMINLNGGGAALSGSPPAPPAPAAPAEAKDAAPEAPEDPTPDELSATGTASAPESLS